MERWGWGAVGVRSPVKRPGGVDSDGKFLTCGSTERHPLQLGKLTPVTLSTGTNRMNE